MTRWRAVVLAVSLAMALPSPAVGTDGDGAVEATVRASPLLVTFTVASDSIQVGQSVKAEARITNIGATTVSGFTVELRADPAGLSTKSALHQVGPLKPGKAATIRWQVCGRSAGSYVVLALVTEEGHPMDGAARMLTVRAGGRKSC